MSGADEESRWKHEEQRGSHILLILLIIICIKGGRKHCYRANSEHAYHANTIRELIESAIATALKNQ